MTFCLLLGRVYMSLLKLMCQEVRATLTSVLLTLVLLNLALGAAYGTAKSGTGIAAMSVMRPELIMKSIIPVVMAGIIAIYGLVVAVLIAQGRK